MFFEKFLEDLPERPFFVKRPYTDINPVSGQQKRRILEVPNEAMKILHQRLIRYLRKLPVNLRFATGSVRGASPLLNVRKHFGQEHFYLLDLHDAYGSVDGKKLVSVLCQFNEKIIEEQKKVLLFLQQYCLSSQKGLAIGAPASPDLFNIYTAVLVDTFLGEFCEKWQVVYTRYLDDFCLSSKDIIGERKRQTIRAIIEQAGFQINHRKSKVCQISKGPIVITGIGLRKDGKIYRVFLPRHYLRKLRGVLHLAKRNPLAMQHLVEGMMGVFKAVADTKHQSPNRTEQKIFQDYRAFRCLLAAQIKKLSR